MLTRVPACWAVCDNPGEVVDSLVAALKSLRCQGISEAEALLISHDPNQVARLLPAHSIGTLPDAAEAVVAMGCAECAVNYAYND